MKPTNAKVPGCNPISSNCVIWQGPDIPCIDLCKGDTVSDTVFKLATELCGVLDQLDVTTYDLSCLNLTTCDPKDFHALIQLLIDKICALNECCSQNAGGTREDQVCPDDCIVAICEAFQYQDQFGNTVTTMPLKDYVVAIGNKVCSIVQQINTINLTLQNHETRITYIEENCCDDTPPALPSLVPTCIGTPPNALVLDDFVQILEAAFCELRAATGTATELYLAINKQCAGLDNENQLSGPGIMATIPGWVTSGNYNTVADAITNMWLTICDMRAAIKYIQENCCPGSCEDFVLTMSASYTNPTLKIFFNGTIPLGFVTCNPGGITVTISDGYGNTINQVINLPTVINTISGYPIDLSATPLNLLSNYTITTTACITNSEDGSQCQTTLTYTVQNQATCPPLEFETTFNTISYSLGVLTPATYVVELLSSCGDTVPIASNTHVVPSASTVLGSFTGLYSLTNYIIRVKVQLYSADVLINETVCPCIPATTSVGPCIAPVLDGSPVITPIVL